MAGENKQIYQLTTGEFTGESLVPFEVPNPDPTTVDEKPKVTRKGSGDAIAEFVAKVQEFQTDLETDSKTLIGAINEVNDGLSDRNNALFHSATLENTDFDTLRTSDKFGIYWCSTGNTHAPQPWGILEVFGSGGVINQRFTAHGGQKVWYREFINNAWIDWVLQTNERTDTSVVRYSGVSTNVPLPQVSRSGNVVIVHFVQQYPSGTYSNLFTISPKPSSDQHAYVNLAGTNTLIRVNTGGTIAFNNSVTTNGGYLIGQLVYITNE